ncbi:MAG: flagellar hook-basal body complex protein [Azospirillum sp.]|nr:flagellar hook-basal body complex protein [Azospirillum sp.]
MGIGAAFSTALSGLNAYSQKISYISDNLANTSTTGYKKVGASFQSYVTASSANYYSPGGVTVKPSYQNTLAGSVSGTGIGTNFAVYGGDGFIPVTKPSVASDGTADLTNTTQAYTRAGDFSVNADGYLVNSAGYYLEGLQEQTAYQGDIPNSATLSTLEPVRIDPAVYGSVPGAASTTIDYNANFPASLDPGSTVASDVQFYDTLGGVHTLQITYTYDPTTTNLWNISAATVDDDSDITVDIGSLDLEFDSTGAVASSPPTCDFSVTWPVTAGQAAQTVTLDYTGSTQHAGSSLEIRSVDDITGQAPGSYQSCAIDSNGYVVLSYSNGEQLKPYRVPLITFNDADQLNRVDGATFTANDLEAGSPIAQWAGSGNAGSISTSAVEASNVDIADELTALIVAQRAYSASGKVITTTDEMIQETLNLKR